MSIYENKIQTKNSPTVYNSTYNVAQLLKFHPIKNGLFLARLHVKTLCLLVVLVNFFMSEVVFRMLATIVKCTLINFSL